MDTVAQRAAQSRSRPRWARPGPAVPRHPVPGPPPPRAARACARCISSAICDDGACGPSLAHAARTACCG
eukprot:12786787-Prorocentrum_lima.AAC.1